ncbi:MAG: alpha/beta hydrolase [Candidatus Tenebribacter davisii]|jgi:hypothetical protein|nr:alpha/beta hydrolase [Candidatus Tenebribacter davisii]
MKNVIIGIHGLKNKPPKDLLEKWWKKAILDGLDAIGYSITDIEFELVYWADLEYSKPLDPQVTDPKNPLFLEHPYVPINKSGIPEKESKIKRKIIDKIDKGFDKLFLHDKGIGGIEKIVDATIKRMFQDLDTYYHGFCKIDKTQNANYAFKQRLINVLKKHGHNRIMLIGHSMGSIIAYDTLMQNFPKLKVDTLVTIGSPLGFPLIIKKILSDQHKEITLRSHPQTPDNIISAWYNFSDLDDKITLDYQLADDYSANNFNIKPVDILINNTYEYNGQKNPHKVYGYLQKERVAKVIVEFLSKSTSLFARLFKRSRS